MLVSNRDTACAFREGYGQDGRPLYHRTLSVRLRDDPEERNAIEIEGDLIEIAGEIDIAVKDMIKDMINVIDVTNVMDTIE